MGQTLGRICQTSLGVILIAVLYFFMVRVPDEHMFIKIIKVTIPGK